MAALKSGVEPELFFGVEFIDLLSARVRAYSLRRRSSSGQTIVHLSLCPTMTKAIDLSAEGSDSIGFASTPAAAISF